MDEEGYSRGEKNARQPFRPRSGSDGFSRSQSSAMTRSQSHQHSMSAACGKYYTVPQKTVLL